MTDYAAFDSSYGPETVYQVKLVTTDSLRLYTNEEVWDVTLLNECSEVVISRLTAALNSFTFTMDITADTNMALGLEDHNCLVTCTLSYRLSIADIWIDYAFTPTTALTNWDTGALPYGDVSVTTPDATDVVQPGSTLYV